MAIALQTHLEPLASACTSLFPRLPLPSPSPSPLALSPLPCPSHHLRCLAHKVEILHDGVAHVFDVSDDEPVLDKALDAGLDLPYDCRLGVCMTCPAKLVAGSVDQSGGMLSDDVVEKGYALLCVALPRSDCQFRTIPEEELLSLQLVTSDH